MTSTLIYGREAKIVDVTIKALKCGDENENKNIVTVQEEIPITICGVEDPYGIRIMSGDLNIVNSNDKDDKLNVGEIKIGGYSKVASVNDKSAEFVLGEGTSSSASYKVTITAMIDCSDYKGDNWLRDCIAGKYRTNV